MNKKLRLNCLLLFLGISTVSATQLKLQKSRFEQQVAHAGTIFAEALNQRNTEMLKTVVDAESLAKTVVKLVMNDKSSSEKKDMVKGLEQSIFANSFKSWYTMLDNTGGRVDYRKVLRIKGEYRSLVRMDMGDSGINYVELIVDRKSAKIVDWFVYTTAQKASESMASIIALTVPDRAGILGSLFGMKKVDKESLSLLRKVGEYNREGKYAESYGALTQLPQKVQDSQFVAITKVGLSTHVSEDVYNNELENLQRLFGDDPKLALMLFDYYFMKKQFDKAINSIQLIEERIGQDGLLSSLKAVVYFTAEDNQQSLYQIDKAIGLEPENEDFYWFKSEVLNKQKNFIEMTELFSAMATRFGFGFSLDYYKTEPSYSEFVKSKAFKVWSKQYVD